MTNIPLIQGNSVQEINTSIIAIKKAQKELETLNTQIDNKIKALNLALSGGPGKYIESIQEVQGLIKVTEGSITDTIASGNSQPATSNGVADAISTEATARDTAIANATNILNTETKTGGKWGENQVDIYIRKFTYNNITLTLNQVQRIDANFPISKSKIISMEGMLIGPNWCSIPGYLYKADSPSSEVGLYVGQNISSSVTCTINVIVRYVK